MKTINFVALKKVGAETIEVVIDKFDRFTEQQADEILFDNNLKRPWRRSIHRIIDLRSFEDHTITSRVKAAEVLESEGWDILVE